MIISHSEVESFQGCKKKHFFAFGLRIEKKQHSVALQRGTIGHDLFAIFFERFQVTRDIQHALTAVSHRAAEIIRATPEFAEMTMEVAILIQDFVENNKVEISTWKILKIEEEDRVELDGYTYAFTPDLVVERAGRILLWDFKFPYDFYYNRVADILPQIPRYAGALRSRGTNVHEGGYIFLRTRKITDPAKPKTKLHKIQLSTKRIILALEDLNAEAKEIVALKSLPRDEWETQARRAPTTVNCKNCQFSDICVVEANGEDASLVKRTEYRPSSYGYREHES